MGFANIDQYIRSVELRKGDVPSFSQYPFCLPAIRNLTDLKLHPNVTWHTPIP